MTDSITEPGPVFGGQVSWINSFFQTRVQGCDVGIYLGMAANAVDFHSPVILSNRIGVQLAGSMYGVRFFGGLNEGQREKGFYFSGPGEKFGIVLSGMYFENACTDIFIDGTAMNITVSGGCFAGYHRDKQPNLIHSNRFPSSGIIFRNNFMYNRHQPVSAKLNGATIISEANYGFGPRKITDGTVLVPRYEKHAPVNGRPPIAPLSPDVDGLPDDLPDSLKIVKQFNFAPQDTPVEIGFTKDYGEIFSVDQGHGWQRDLTQKNRWRSLYPLLPDTSMLTRTHDIWECELPNGKYVVDLSIGDSAHEQFGKN